MEQGGCKLEKFSFFQVETGTGHGRPTSQRGPETLILIVKFLHIILKTPFSHYSFGFWNVSVIRI